MTLLDDPPMVESSSPAPIAPIENSSPTATWRFAGRLARREVRRRPGRTLLVMLLISVPVLGMTIGSLVVRTEADGAASGFRREFGAADLQYSGDGRFLYDEAGNLIDGVNDADDVGTPALPTGSLTLDYVETWTSIRGNSPDGRAIAPNVHLSTIDPSDPLAAGIYVLDEGEFPVRDGEAMLSSDVAEDFGVEVGDTLRLTRPDLSLTVTAIAREARHLSQSAIVIPRFETDLFKPGWVNARTLVDLPASITADQTRALLDGFRSAGYEAETPTQRFWTGDDAVQTETLAWGWVAGAVAFVAVGIVIAAAFATSARRQLATVGQLSANGAPERLVRRTLGLQGLWTGAFGAVLGLAVGLSAAVIGYRAGLAETLAGHRVEQLRLAPLDLVIVVITALVAATLAALVPARSAARVPVLAALAGRRPVNDPPRWLVPVGVGLFGFGVFLLAAAASSNDGGNLAAATAVLGALGVLFGVVCSSPLIVSWISRVGSRRGGVVRLAARSLGRSRMRSAGVLTAVATVSALSIAGLTAAGSAADGVNPGSIETDYSIVAFSYSGDIYAGAAVDQFGNTDPDFDPPPMVVPELPDGLRSNIEAILPDATWLPISQVVFDEVPSTAYNDPEFEGRTIVVPDIADDVVLSQIVLTDAQRSTLDGTGVLALNPFLTGEVVVNTADGFVSVDTGAVNDNVRPEFLSDQFYTELLITPEYAAERGFEVQVQQIIVDNPTDLTKEQRDAINASRPLGDQDAFVADASVSGEAVDADPETGQWYFYANDPLFEIPWPVIQAAVLAASLLLVLLVVAIGLSLAATESRDERDVLHTVGAAPKTLRRVAAVKAWVLTTGAGVVAVPAGYIVVRVVTWVNEQTAPFPVIGALGILVVIPVVAAAATLAVSAIAQKARPITVSTISPD